MASKRPPPFNPQTFLTKVGKGKTSIKSPKKHIFYSQGDAADAVFYIQRGKVKLTVVSQQGKEAVVAILEQGSARGEARLVGGSAAGAAVGVAEAGPISDPWRSDAFLALLLTSH
jgi:CRP/FNR family cyclic AMP-dependent transcriptional regulator